MKRLSVLIMLLAACGGGVSKSGGAADSAVKIAVAPPIARALAAPQPPAPPVAKFTQSCSAARVCRFDGSSSVAPAGALAYSWYFGDGSAAGGAVIPSKYYKLPGTYLVRFVLTDSLRRSSTAQDSVTVGAVSTTSTSVVAVGDTWNLAQSPHASWVSVMYTNFSNRLGPIQAWAAANLDYSMSGGPPKTLNPTYQIYPYTLEHQSLVDSTPDPFSVTTKFGADVKLWAAANGADPESIWIHDTLPADSAHRRREFTWTDWKWCVNPKAALSYQVDRYKRIVAGADGAFMDSWDSGSLQGCGKPSHEFPTTAAYDSAQLMELRAIRAVITPRLLMPNLSAYITSPFGIEAAKAAGATHLEKLDNPFNSNLQANWHAIDSLMQLGVFAEYVAAYSYSELLNITRLFPTYTAGTYHSTVDRAQIAELAAYYMVVPQVPWKHLALDEQNLWDVRPDTVFPAAYKVNVGHPAEARRLYLSGTDATGRTYQVFGRQFTRALVLLRVAQGYAAQDFSWPETVMLAKPGRLLHRDGTLDPPISSIQLRVGEGAILIQ